MADEPTKFLLGEDAIPTHWVNLLPELPGDPLPPLHPGTMQPAGPDDLTPIFPMALIGQEVSAEPEVEIPDAVREAYKLWRPTPLYRALRLERELGTPARIYYKYEGGSPAGSHKPNTAVAQAYENAQAGVGKLTTETGAGQWGSALAFACTLFGLQCEVFMVGSSYDQKPYRRSMMQTWGATVHRSPSEITQSGRANAGSPTGSLGIAISEAVEVAAQDAATNYSLGSVLNHVLLHQTVIGQESIAQMALAGDEPDVVIGCVGGGSNFAGLAFPFLREKIAGKEIDVLACEPAACPTLTRGPFAYDFGDTGQLTPLVPMHTLGHDFVPAPIHAGGLRYHGVAPLISQLVLDGFIRAEAYTQSEVFASAVNFARCEGIIPAPEAAHAVHGAIGAAAAADEAGEQRTILFNLSGHGHFDLGAYDAYFAGKLEDIALADEEIERALEAIEALPKPAAGVS
jgi:tryptophan synthase beta chain